MAIEKLKISHKAQKWNLHQNTN